MRVLLMGFADTVLTALDKTLPAGSVTVLEEPDLWEGRGLADKAAVHPCFGEIRLGRYQQDDHYLDVVADLGPLDVVAPVAEYAVLPAARVAELLGLPGAGRPAAQVLRDKLLLRAVTARARMTTPRFQEIGCAEDIAEFARGRPCVVKPAARQASLGVVLLDTGADVDAAWRECSEADEGTQIARRPMAWRYLVEERLYGPEYSTECLVRDGALVFLNITRKRTLAGPRPVEIGHVVPGAPSEETGIWARAVRHLVQAVDFGSGMLHAEWIWMRGEPVLIECAGRPPGDRITDLVDLAHGVNLIDMWIHLLAGVDLAVEAEPIQGAAVRYLVPAEEGVIHRIDGMDKAGAVPGVRRVNLLRRPGDKLGEVRSSWDRAGWVIASGGTPDEADFAAGQAVSLIQIQVS